MNKVFLFNTKYYEDYYFYFDYNNLYLSETSRIRNLYSIPLNIEYNSVTPISKFEIMDYYDKLKYSELDSSLRNAEEISCYKYFYDDFFCKSKLNFNKLYYRHMIYMLKDYEYLKFFAILANRDNKIDKII